MTRVIKSRRAGLSRDQARQQPLYARLLGLQYLTPSGFLCFVFFEGAVALGVLLALAELVSWWGVLVLPITVAAMVKLNDVVAGALTHPAAAAARARGARDASQLAELGSLDDATMVGAGRSLPAASSPALRRAAVRPAAVPPSGPIPPSGPSQTPGMIQTSGRVPPSGSNSRSGLPPVGNFRPTGAFPPAGPAPAQSIQWWAPQRERDEPEPGNADYRSWRPGAWAPDRQFSESRMSATRTRPAMPSVDVTGSGALNEPPAARQWPAAGESLDDPEQWARQAASRRYE